MIPEKTVNNIRKLESAINAALDSGDLPTYRHRALPLVTTEEKLCVFLHALFAMSAKRSHKQLAQTAGMARDIAIQHGVIELMEVCILTVAQEITRLVMDGAFRSVSSICYSLNVPNPVCMYDTETGEPVEDSVIAEEQLDDELLATDGPVVEEPEWARNLRGSRH